MELQLKNIGMIEEANVKIDGLTVIAGENDTGKSTLSKALYLIVSSLIREGRSSPEIFGVNDVVNLDRVNSYGKYIEENIFSKQYFIATSLIKLLDNDKTFVYEDGFIKDTPYEKDIKVASIMFIETPLVWNFTDFFRDIAQVESQMRIELDYPYLMKDLNFKLHIKNASDGIDIKKKMTDLMGGEFKKDEMGRYYFDKQGQRIELVNTATGIKYFGIFQILSQNNYLNDKTIFILDEPEVHLHPKWQLEMANIVVELVGKGVRVVVNSHSPYMIEALKRYSDREKLQDKTNFYLAEDGIIDKIEESNSQTLVAIYEKLSEPYDIFEEMESERFQNG